MQTIPGSRKRDNRCLELSILLLEMISYGKPRYNLLWHDNILMGKSGACIKLSIKLRKLGDTWRNLHSTPEHQQDIDRIALVVFIFYKIKQLHLESKILILQCGLFLNNNFKMVSVYQHMRSLVYDRIRLYKTMFMSNYHLEY